MMPNGQRFPGPPPGYTRPIRPNEKVVQALYDHRTGTILLPSGPNGQMMQCNYGPAQQMSQMYQGRHPNPMGYQQYPGAVPMRYPSQPAPRYPAQTVQRPPIRDPTLQPNQIVTRSKKEHNPEFVDLISDDEDSQDAGTAMSDPRSGHKSPLSSVEESPPPKPCFEKRGRGSLPAKSAKALPRSRKGKEESVSISASATDSLFDGESIFSSPGTPAPSPKRKSSIKARPEIVLSPVPVKQPLPSSVPKPQPPSPGKKRNRRSEQAGPVAQPKPVPTSTVRMTRAKEVTKAETAPKPQRPTRTEPEKPKGAQAPQIQAKQTAKKTPEPKQATKGAPKRRPRSPSPSPEPEPESEDDDEEEEEEPTPPPKPPVKITKKPNKPANKAPNPTISKPTTVPSTGDKLSVPTSSRANTRSQKVTPPPSVQTTKSAPEKARDAKVSAPIKLPEKPAKTDDPTNQSKKGRKRPIPAPSPKKETAPAKSTVPDKTIPPSSKKTKVTKIEPPIKDEPKKQEEKKKLPPADTVIKSTEKKEGRKKKDSRGNESSLSCLLSATFPSRFARIVEKKTKTFFTTHSNKLLQCKLCPDLFGNGTAQIKQHVFKHLKEKDNLEVDGMDQDEFDEFLASQSRELIRTMRDCFFPRQNGEEEEEQKDIPVKEKDRVPFQFLRLLETLTRRYLQAAKIPCQFPRCDTLISNSRGNVLERHIYSHFDRNLYKCLGGCEKSLKGIYDHFKKAHKGETPRFIDIRGDHEPELIHIANTCFPEPKKRPPPPEPETEDILVVDEQNPRNMDGIKIPEKFYEALREGIEKWRGQMPLQCRFQSKANLCNATFPKDWKLSQFEDHVLKHFGQKVFKCLDCNVRFVSGIEDHFKTAHNKALDSRNYKDMRHSYEKDLVAIFKRCLPKDQATNKMSAEMRRLMQAEAAHPRKMAPNNTKGVQLRDYPEPSELIAFAQTVADTIRVKKGDGESDSEGEGRECHYQNCEFQFDELSVQQVEDHLLVHYKPSVFNCLGCEVRFESSQQAERHTCDATRIADLRSKHEKHLLIVGKRCFPQVSEKKVSVATNESAQEYDALQKEVLKRLGGRKIRCLHSSRCNYSCRLDGSQSALLTLENHVLYHMGPLKVYQCLFCWKKLPSPTDNHFSRHHPSAEGSQKVKDLRYLYEKELVIGLRTCFLPSLEARPAVDNEPEPSEAPKQPPQKRASSKRKIQEDSSYSESEDWAQYSFTEKTLPRSSPVPSISRKTMSNAPIAPVLTQKKVPAISAPQLSSQSRTKQIVPTPTAQAVSSRSSTSTSTFPRTTNPRTVPSYQQPTRSSLANAKIPQNRQSEIYPLFDSRRNAKPTEASKYTVQPGQGRISASHGSAQRKMHSSENSIGRGNREPIEQQKSAQIHPQGPTPIPKPKPVQREVPEMSRPSLHARRPERGSPQSSHQVKVSEFARKTTSQTASSQKSDGDEIKIVGEVKKSTQDTGFPQKRDVKEEPKPKPIDKLAVWTETLNAVVDNAKHFAEIECEDNKCDFFTGTRTLTAAILEDHVIGKHLRRRIFRCLICGSRLQLRTTAAKHLLNKHKIKFIDTEIDDGRTKCFTTLLKELKRCFPIKELPSAEPLSKTTPADSDSLQDHNSSEENIILRGKSSVQSASIENAASVSSVPLRNTALGLISNPRQRFGPRGPYHKRQKERFNFGFSNLEAQNEFLGGLLPILGTKAKEPPVTEQVSQEIVSNNVREAERMLEESLAQLGASEGVSKPASSEQPISEELTAGGTIEKNQSVPQLNILVMTSIFGRLQSFIDRVQDDLVPQIPKLNILSMKAIIGGLTNLVTQHEAENPCSENSAEPNEEECKDAEIILHEEESKEEFNFSKSPLPKKIQETIRRAQLIIYNEDSSSDEEDEETDLKQDDFDDDLYLKPSLPLSFSDKMFPSQFEVESEIESIMSESASFISDMEQFRRKSLEAVYAFERRGRVRKLSEVADIRAGRSPKRMRLNTESSSSETTPDETKVWIELFTEIMKASAEESMSLASTLSLPRPRSLVEPAHGQSDETGDELEVASAIVKFIEEDSMKTQIQNEAETNTGKGELDDMMMRIEDKVLNEEIDRIILEASSPEVDGDTGEPIDSLDDSAVVSTLLEFLMNQNESDAEANNCPESSRRDDTGTKQQTQTETGSENTKITEKTLDETSEIERKMLDCISSSTKTDTIVDINQSELELSRDSQLKEDAMLETIAEELLAALVSESLNEKESQEHQPTLTHGSLDEGDLDDSTESIEIVVEQLKVALLDACDSDQLETPSVSTTSSMLKDSEMIKNESVSQQETGMEHDNVPSPDLRPNSPSHILSSDVESDRNEELDGTMESQPKSPLNEALINELLKAWLAEAIYEEATSIVDQALALQKARAESQDISSILPSYAQDAFDVPNDIPCIVIDSNSEKTSIKEDSSDPDVQEVADFLVQSACRAERSSAVTPSPDLDNSPRLLEATSPERSNELESELKGLETSKLDETFKSLLDGTLNATTDTLFYDALDETPTRPLLSLSVPDPTEEASQQVIDTISVRSSAENDGKNSIIDEKCAIAGLLSNDEDKILDGHLDSQVTGMTCDSPQFDVDPSIENDILGEGLGEDESDKELIDEMWASVFA